MSEPARNLPNPADFGSNPAHVMSNTANIGRPGPKFCRAQPGFGEAGPDSVKNSFGPCSGWVRPDLGRIDPIGGRWTHLGIVRRRLLAGFPHLAGAVPVAGWPGCSTSWECQGHLERQHMRHLSHIERHTACGFVRLRPSAAQTLRGCTFGCSKTCRDDVVIRMSAMFGLCVRENASHI